MAIKQICAWCKCNIGTPSATAIDGEESSHGICSACYELIMEIVAPINLPE
jgi:hypothetical protein